MPDGVLRWALDWQTDRQDRAFTRDHTTSPLLRYLVPEASVRNQLSGKISRETRQTTLRVDFGLSDTWNLGLVASQVQVTQSSTVRAKTADPMAQDAAADFSSRTVSGPGDASLWSLHRTVYGDYHGFVVGAGIRRSMAAPEGPWRGHPTLITSSPTPALLGVLHYTYFPASTRARYEFRLHSDYGLPARVTLSGNSIQKLYPGNTLGLNTGWRQEWGPTSLGLLLLMHYQTASRLNGVSQHDPVKELASRLEWGVGNLRALEQGPQSFPFHLQLWAERSWLGFNSPVRHELGVTFFSYY
ncbi:MAG: hypothetical protein OEW39_05275 [Deltaproteobacteria bacterium]|nr:hypothetical protein [Deltaproteobacteria bacterium]